MRSLYFGGCTIFDDNPRLFWVFLQSFVDMIIKRFQLSLIIYDPSSLKPMG
ncbi:hypothetical protein CWATWH0402_314 [Crocosphaera watsonii WH 0402]|uniref:Uncharacterized protein n=3 Tax=Crocosphaera watsonii TaxID=263511 RepID=T2JX15_CROWT|nr:hypothetical protein CWATWH0003_0937 [Crocosphaera watsonii WH 0003]CCQ56929.1 hypothetical protein CWATWH0005_980 [Crocosphaera watsonii WH 0005]CCQ69566.1 hypothetical protein CWATWH0402_314 [Crocosphaera watsonii WH 0402]